MLFKILRGLVIALSLNGQAGEGKFVGDKVKLRMNFQDLSNWTPGRRVMMDGLHYITHFACQIGKCTWEMRVKALNPARVLNRASNHKDYIVDEQKFTPVQEYGIWRYFSDPDTVPQELQDGRSTDAAVNMRIILDAEWNDKGLSKTSFTGKMAGKECMGDLKSRLTREIQVPLNGNWSKWYSGALLQKARPHHWYFVLEDCRGNFVKEFTDAYGIRPQAFLPNVHFEYEMRLLNVDGSHFGYEYWGMPLFTFLTGMTAMFGALYYAHQQYLIIGKSQGIHPIVQTVNAALLTMILFLFMHWLHLVKFKGDGIGYPSLDVFAYLLRSFGNVTLMISIFAVALGYSLHVNEMTIPGEAFMALASCYGFVELVLSFAQYKTSSFRYHIHASEGVIPILISVFRSLLAIAFVVSCEATKNRGDYSNDSVRVFIDKFRWRGTLMMASTPIIIIVVTTMFPHYQQNRYIEMLCTVAELGGIIYLGVAFVSSKTSYFKASADGNSLLPFGGMGINRNSFANHRID